MYTRIGWVAVTEYFLRCVPASADNPAAIDAIEQIIQRERAVLETYSDIRSESSDLDRFLQRGIAVFIGKPGWQWHHRTIAEARPNVLSRIASYRIGGGYLAPAATS